MDLVAWRCFPKSCGGSFEPGWVVGLAQAARAQKQLPSISLYFTDPLADLIGSGGEHPERPIQRLSRTVFACGDKAVVVRYAHKRDLAVLRSRRFDARSIC